MDNQPLIEKIKTSILNRYNLSEIVDDSLVKEAISLDYSPKVLVLRCLDVSGRKIWEDDKKLILELDNSHLHNLAALGYDFLKVLAECGSQYVHLQEESRDDDDYFIPETLVFQGPFKDYIGGFIEKDKGSVLGIVFPGRNNRQTTTSRKIAVGIESALTGKPDREITF
jgi:hypothetical protein